MGLLASVCQDFRAIAVRLRLMSAYHSPVGMELLVWTKLDIMNAFVGQGTQVMGNTHTHHWNFNTHFYLSFFFLFEAILIHLDYCQINFNFHCKI